MMRLAAIGLTLYAGLLAACSDDTLPFSKARDAPPARTPPTVVVSTITGLPEEQEAAFFGALVNAGAVRGIRVGRRNIATGYRLAGEFVKRDTDIGKAVSYRWTLTDERGRVLHRIEEIEAASESPDFGDIPLGRIAAYTAESLSNRLSQLGHATRAAGMPPPLDHLVQAGLGAEQEIDYETLGGLGRSAVFENLAGQEPVVAKDLPYESDDAIDGVTITDVDGAGAAGNSELASALARVLTDAGWPVHRGSRDNALMIEGDVRVSEPDGKAQKVTLRWTVKAPDGRVLGTVEQANDVPAGSLDSGWGEGANQAAFAAAQGIFDLVGKLR